MTEADLSSPIPIPTPKEASPWTLGLVLGTGDKGRRALTKPLRAANVREVQLKRLGESQPLCSSQCRTAVPVRKQKASVTSWKETPLCSALKTLILQFIDLYFRSHKTLGGRALFLHMRPNGSSLSKSSQMTLVCIWPPVVCFIIFANLNTLALKSVLIWFCFVKKAVK